MSPENEQQPLVEEPEPRVEEWHVTVENVHAVDWFNFCNEFEGVKPLYIELSTRALHMMCAMADDPRAPRGEDGKSPSFEQEILGYFAEHGVKIVRVKHEVSALRQGEKICYYEAHVKLDGDMRVDRKLTSRELYRGGRRWYMTKRSPEPFNPSVFAKQAVGMSKGSKIVGCEYEICVEDTNPKLDEGWFEVTR